MKTSTTRTLFASTVVLGAALLTGCSSMGSHPAFQQTSVPENIRVPAGNQIAWETTGRGKITYECRPQANMPAQMEWVFVGPQADLMDRSGKKVGTYYGPPATWQAMDGSKITATQLAVAPAGDGNLPYQLVKAQPAMGNGTMQGVSYIQRVALKGGVAPAVACTAAGQRMTVDYQADYIFWKMQG